MHEIGILAVEMVLMTRRKNVLGLILSEVPWQYYIKYEQFLHQLNHPFKQQIDFIRDTRFEFPEAIFKQYKAIAFYYHDPLADLYPNVYAYAKRLAIFCQEHGIQLIQTPQALSNTIKSVQLNLLKQAGIRVADAVSLKESNALAYFFEKEIPFYIRFDVGHDSQGQFMQGPFFNRKEFELTFNESNFKPNKHLKELVAIAWVDTRCTDGLYRKYRAYATPYSAIKGFVTQSESWYIHGNNAHQSEAAMAKQHEFIQTPLSPQETALLINVAKVLQLDFCAIDYAYLPNGSVVVWEANPHPALSDKEPSRTRITEFLSAYYTRILTP